MRDTSINSLREHYYLAISKCTDLEEVKRQLPTGDFINFNDLIDGIISCLESDLEEWNSLGNDLSSEELQEVELLRTKISLCEERKKSVNAEVDDEKRVERSYNRNIIFAETKMGNCYLFEDVKDIDPSFYGEIIDLLYKLLDGNIIDNKEKNRQLGNDKNVKGVREVKGFKVRLYYQFLGKGTDILYVIGAKVKKDNFSRKDREFVGDRKNKTDLQFNNLRNSATNKELIEEIVSKNEVLLDSILSYLDEHKRGDGNGKK